MQRLYFIRHGESLANAGGTPLPNADIPLTEKGHTQAKNRLTHWQQLGIRPSHIYHSAMLRTQQTALPFCQYYDMTASTLDLLDELNTLAFDAIEDISVDARRLMNANWWQTVGLDDRHGVGADSFGEFMGRVDTFIGRIDDFADNTLFFGHGIWLGLLAYRLMNLPVRDNADIRRFRAFQTAMPMHNTVLYRLDVADDAKSLVWIAQP
ncbi:histidine phosphatase family protein [Moraxella sp. K127]|uniref:histidine phosphatase family protein n=1 Tax=Moraxella TaxID=475 RepID=UPI0018822252|nr:histidine phosphatase family protein [Moraxella sp. K127]MBE9590374.1 histidine phosphatase family protein [Moraxella sp. K127]